MEAASRFLARLTPADRVGLIAFPGDGPAIDFTSNHAVVQSALPGLTGLTDTFPSSYRIGDLGGPGDRPGRSHGPQHRHPSRMRQPPQRRRAGPLPADTVVTDSNGIFSSVNERTQTALTTLRSIIDRLSQTPTPKTIVYISEGLVIERSGDVAWLGPAAARGQVTIYALQLEVLRVGRVDGQGAGVARTRQGARARRARHHRRVDARRGASGGGERRQRVRASRARAVRLLPRQLRARVRRSRRQAAPESRSSVPAARARHPRPEPVLHRGAGEARPTMRS